MADQTRLEWLRERARGLGGSDMGVVLGVSRFKTRRELWAEKVRGISGDVTDGEESPDMKRGNFMERHVRRFWEERTGRRTRAVNKCYVHDMFPWARGNIDGRILPCPGAKAHSGPGVLEIKVPRTVTFVRFKHEGISPEYMIQMQHYIGLTGLSWGSFGIFSPDCWELLTFDVDRDDDLLYRMYEEGNRFWEHVLARIEPPPLPGGDVPVVKIPAELMGDVTPASEVCDEREFIRAVREFREADELQKQAADLKSGAKTEILGLVGSGDVAVEGGGFRVYHKGTKGRMAFDAKKFAKEHPEIDLEKFKTRGQPGRMFRVYTTPSGEGDE